MPDYPPKQLEKLLENLPQDLKEAIFSEDAGKSISDIAERNGVSDDNLKEEVAKQTGYVMLGILEPDELKEALKKECDMEDAAAQQIVWEIKKFVFLPLKDSLEALYGKKLELGPTERENTERPKRNDTYRETIE